MGKATTLNQTTYDLSAVTTSGSCPPLYFSVNLTVSDSVSLSPKGGEGGAGSAPLNPPLAKSSTTMIIRKFEINNIRQLDMHEIKLDCCKPEVV